MMRQWFFLLTFLVVALAVAWLVWTACLNFASPAVCKEFIL